MYRVQNWIRQRFVLVCEVTGYAISCIVGVFLIYAALTQVEVTVPVSGALSAVSTPIRLDQDALVLDYLVDAGTRVSKGQVVMRVTKVPAEQRQAMARKLLAEATLLLEDQPGLKDALLKAMSAVPADPVGTDVAAPAAGWFRPMSTDRAQSIVRSGEVLGWIDDYETLRFSGAVEATESSARARDGQDARAYVEGMPDPLLGRVLGSSSSEHGDDVWVGFDAVPAAVSSEVRAHAEGGEDRGPLRARVEIVVDRRSLFRRVFGQR